MEQTKTELTTLTPWEGFVIAKWNKGHKYVELGDAEAEVKHRIKWQNGASVNMILHFPNPFRFSMKAHNYLKSAEGRAGITACAVVTEGIWEFAAARFALWVSNEKFPITVVRSEEEAVEWFRENPVGYSYNMT